MKQIKTFFARFTTYIFIVLFAGSLTANAEIKVVTTIKPLHSLISNVMDGVGEPSLIIEGSTSPHSFVLKPSHAKMIEQADIIFWIGEDIETFMEKPLESIAKNAKKISFMELTSIEKLKFREENIFDHDDHDDHGHGEKKDHDDHGHGEDKDHDDHGHGEKKDHDDHGHGEDKDHDDHGHGEKKDHDDHGHGHEGHNHGEFDAHIWLDPANAKEMLHEIAHELADLDPDNASKYESNADQAIKSIDQMIKDIDTNINKDAKFIVFHDAYQYFETRFGVMTAGALTLNTDVLPGAKQISVDQGFKKQSITNSSFYIPGFSVCMQVKSVHFEHEVILGKCDNMNLDSFIFSENNEIHLTNDKSYCLTVVENSLRTGKGGSPIHKMRDIELQKCNKNIHHLQKWGYRN